MVRMNWYNTAQNTHENKRNFPPNLPKERGFSETAFPGARKIVNGYNMDEMLSRVAIRSAFYSSLDYLLCTLYPEYEKPCQNYYNGDGKPLAELLSPEDAKKLDKIIGQAAYFLYQKKISGLL